MADAYYRCFLSLLCLICFVDEELFLFKAKAELHPAPDFSRHALVKPRIYHGREKRQISTIKEEDGKYTHQISISYDIDGKNYTLDLQLSRQLLPKGYFQRYQKNGKHVVNRPSAEDVELCQYQGKIRGIPDSWVALSACNNDGITGMVFDGKEVHYLHKTGKDENAELDDLHFIYKHSDLVDNNKTCGYDGGGEPHKIAETDEFNRILRYKRATEPTGHVKGPYNANRQSRYVELVLVVDNSEFKEMGENIERVERHCKSIANIVNALYAPLNIFIALVGIIIWSERDEVNFSSNGDTTLTNFLHYRREKLIKEHPNDNAQLLTKFTFDHGVVGKALKGPICTIEYSGGISTDHSTVLALVATTIAHEMGHNFGMEHDTNDCVCPEDRCIMAPSSSSTPPMHWSSCSLDYLALAFEHGMEYCLRNKPENLLDSPVCGNGFVEPGEQCDCGLPEHCDNTCCNVTTCMLYSNATCATGECCDLQSCRPKTAGTLCRSADLECDLPEYCTGQSEYCPADIYKTDTTVCDGGKAFCYQGSCRTRSDQCKLLWGETGKSSDDQCYLLNTKGSKYGNCGYNKLNQSFAKCLDEDVFCGMLHCKHLNERLEFGMESVSILAHSFINVKGSVVPCRTALVDLGINQIDPGLVPDGAKCNENKMCVNQKCMPVASLRNAIKTCPNDCNGNGYCNSLGHCHCKDGYAPPFCDYPGFGGSEDSGPTRDPDARKDFATVMFIIFLGIIPALAIFGFLMYYTKHNLKFTWKKSSPAKKSPPKTRGVTSSASPPKPSDDIHSLLQNEAPRNIGFKNEFFGNFKGFSITPLKSQEPEPIRPAPPVPIVHSIIKPSTVTKTNTIPITNSNDDHSVPPALPPLNPGAHPRPIISSPILENSTCTAKELLSPLRNAPKVPVRVAPTAPDNVRPLSSSDTIMVATIIPEEEKKSTPKENPSALNRIASFLKSDKRAHHSSTLPKNFNQNVKVTKVLDKNALRSIEISNPILQTNITIPTSTTNVNVTENKPVVMRAQSMRGGTVTQRPNIPNFGSMRNPSGNKRPVSIPAANRPKSPPPPRPPLPGVIKIPSLPGYQKPSAPVQNQYDDCLNEVLSKIKEEKEGSPVNDNIYAVIDEIPAKIEPEKSSVKSSPESCDNVGLLGEIVNEIQNRNGDSIYSTSTLARKKKEEEEMGPSDKEKEIYVNTSPTYKVPESFYSNMSNGKSSASSTSSGYINPSSVNPPIKQSIADAAAKIVKSPPTPTKSTLSTFKVDPKPDVGSAPSRTTSTFKTGNHGKVLNRQTTPPQIHTPKPSLTKTPSSPKVAIKPTTKPTTKPTSNSPDLVMSCSNNAANAKSPDVLGSAPSVLKKPNLPKSVPKVTNKSVSLKNAADRKLTNSDSKPVVSAKVTKSELGGKPPPPSGARVAARQNSNVAALQQKFENKLPPFGTKPTLAKNQ